ncbi:MAG: hypothetical protein K0V04_21470 [Deltaproteobacteria bacterium]|nr:hypothetical protein [Deltaproteobacteria bacterium]
METHIPPSNKYIAGHITEKLEFEADNLTNGVFRAPLGVLKIENHSRQRCEVQITLERNDQNEVTQCVRATVPHGEWVIAGNPPGADGGRYGIWAVIPAVVNTVWVSVNDNEYELRVRNVAHEIEIDKSGPHAKSGEANHVYFQGSRIDVINDYKGAWDGTITWAKDDQPDTTTPIQRIPSGGPGSHTVTISLDPTLHDDLGDGWRAVSLELNSVDVPGRTGVFELFDVDGNEVQILSANYDGVTKIGSAPYAITPQSSTVKVVNNLLSISPDPNTISVWPTGYKVGNVDVDPPVEGQSVNPGNSVTFDVVDPSEADANTPNDQVPYRGPGVDGSPTFTRQAGLNWLVGGDPKVVIKQNDCGAG